MRACAYLIFLLLLGAILASVSTLLNPRLSNLPDAVASQQAILRRTPFVLDGAFDDISNWRNRLMIPYAMAGVARITGMSPGQSYLLVRWLSASLALAAFAALAMRAIGLPPWGGAAATLLLAVSLVPTFLHIYEVPSDFLDAAFFSWLTGAALRRQRWIFGAILLVALVNRESAVFAVFVWWALHAFGRGRRGNFLRESAWCAAWGAASALFVAWLRTANSTLGRAETIRIDQNFLHAGVFWSVNLRFFRDYASRPSYSHPFFYLGGYLLLIALVFGTEWTSLPPWARRLFWVAGGIFGLSIISNNLDELRIFIPSIVLVTLGMCAIARTKLAAYGQPVKG